MSRNLLDDKTARAIRDEGDAKLALYEPHHEFTDSGGQFAVNALLHFLETLSAHEGIAKVGKTKLEDPHNLGCMTVNSFTTLTKINAYLETRVIFSRPTIVDIAYLKKLERCFGDRVEVSFFEMFLRVSRSPVKSKTLRYSLQFECPRKSTQTDEPPTKRPKVSSDKETEDA